MSGLDRKTSQVRVPCTQTSVRKSVRCFIIGQSNAYHQFVTVITRFFNRHEHNYTNFKWTWSSMVQSCVYRGYIYYKLDVSWIIKCSIYYQLIHKLCVMRGGCVSLNSYHFVNSRRCVAGTLPMLNHVISCIFVGWMLILMDLNQSFITYYYIFSIYIIVISYSILCMNRKHYLGAQTPCMQRRVSLCSSIKPPDAIRCYHSTFYQQDVK